MSIDAGLVVKGDFSDISAVLRCFEESGLELYSPGGTVEMIVSRDDSFTWGDIHIPHDELYARAAEHDIIKSAFGIMLFKNGSKFTSILIVSDDEIIISCDINRKTYFYGDTELTDVNFFIEMLVVPLMRNFSASGFEYMEYK